MKIETDNHRGLYRKKKPFKEHWKEAVISHLESSETDSHIP
jgi:hypothetical protein